MPKIQKPILDSGLFESIENSLTMYSSRDVWRDWGMSSIREQGCALLFHGPSGTGKTTTARWIAKYLGLRFRPIDFSEIGSDKPGQLGKNIKYLFNSAIPIQSPDVADTRPCMIFLDECDTVLVDRRKLAYNALWMLEPINQLLVSIREYPGLVILATNADLSFLDPALNSRLLAKFYFGRPQEELTRVNLWKSKWPSRLPVKISDQFLDIAARYDFTGNEIENFLIQWTGDAIRNSNNDNPKEHLKVENLINMLLKVKND